MSFDRKNLFIGPNGSGKSNLLEALGFLGILRSFRTSRINELIRLGCDGFHLRGVWQQPSGSAVQLEVALNRSGQRQLQINGTLESSGRDFIQHFYPVVFAPEDMDLVCGIPTLRRRFFDMLASQLDDGYINVLHDYMHALKLRNLALRSGKCNLEKLKIYEGLLAFAGADLTARRQRCVEKFNHVLSGLADDPQAKLNFDYRMQCSSGPEAYLELFDRNRNREMEKRVTLCGCHLDDFNLLRGNQLMRGFASNGQNRLAALHCKLAAALLVMHNRGAEKLVALVDDVTGELDEYNRMRFYRLLEPAGQLFFTFTEQPAEDFFAGAKIFDFPLSAP